MQNQIEPTEQELKIRNYSPKTIKSYLYGLKEYFAFKKKDFKNLSDPFGPACQQAGWTISSFSLAANSF